MRKVLHLEIMEIALFAVERSLALQLPKDLYQALTSNLHAVEVVLLCFIYDYLVSSSEDGNRT